MSPERLPRQVLCPCGSGKTYGDCCYDKGFEYLTDEDGNVFKAVPMSDELAEILEEQRQKFLEQYQREPGPEDKVFFDMPSVEHAEHFLVEAMKQAGIPPAIIFAFEKTGLLVTEENQDLLSDKDLAMWAEAIDEYEARHLEDAGWKDDDEQLF